MGQKWARGVADTVQQGSGVALHFQRSKFLSLMGDLADLRLECGQTRFGSPYRLERVQCPKCKD
jgi:hypothetical protein